MIDYKALKIGNYMQKADGELCTVHSLDYKGEGECLVNGNSPEMYNPVKLTDDIVLKSGFVYAGKDGNIKHYRHYITSLGISLVDDKFYFVYCDKIGDLILEDKISIKIENLHRLQNLFYCLSGCSVLKVNL